MPWMRMVAQTAGCVATHVLQPAGADVPGGCGRDDSGGGAGRAAVPHLRCAADAHGGHRAGAVAQFMMHMLGCMSDGKGMWGWLCVCACTGYVSVSVEGQLGSKLSLKLAVHLAKSLVCACTVKNVYKACPHTQSLWACPCPFLIYYGKYIN